jgi:hypothetical protein
MESPYTYNRGERIMGDEQKEETPVRIIETKLGKIKIFPAVKRDTREDIEDFYAFLARLLYEDQLSS